MLPCIVSPLFSSTDFAFLIRGTVLGTDSQAIPGNYQNASPTNQKTAGSNLDWTS